MNQDIDDLTLELLLEHLDSVALWNLATITALNVAALEELVDDELVPTLEDIVVDGSDRVRQSVEAVIERNLTPLELWRDRRARGLYAS